MTSRYDGYRRQRKRVRVGARERAGYLFSSRKWAALCGPVSCRQMTPEERARHAYVRKAPDPYEREEPP
jgi:hypothetical protein